MEVVQNGYETSHTCEEKCSATKKIHLYYLLNTLRGVGMYMKLQVTLLFTIYKTQYIMLET